VKVCLAELCVDHLNVPLAKGDLKSLVDAQLPCLALPCLTSSYPYGQTLETRGAGTATATDAIEYRVGTNAYIHLTLMMLDSKH
jgi:hypothetical protein